MSAPQPIPSASSLLADSERSRLVELAGPLPPNRRLKTNQTYDDVSHECVRLVCVFLLEMGPAARIKKADYNVLVALVRAGVVELYARLIVKLLPIVEADSHHTNVRPCLLV